MGKTNDSGKRLRPWKPTSRRTFASLLGIRGRATAKEEKKGHDLDREPTLSVQSLGFLPIRYPPRNCRLTPNLRAPGPCPPELNLSTRWREGEDYQIFYCCVR